MMEKFVLLTRGRTGSTAVLDELGKCDALCVTQELFLRYHDLEKLGDYYRVLPPFDLWKQQGLWWKWMIADYRTDSGHANRYLTHAKELARRQGANGFGWKVLSHQFDERPFLRELLRQHGYRVVYLRRNIAPQVLSGMVANLRGIYNSLEDVVDERRYHIDTEKFRWHVQWERECVKNDCTSLKAEGFDFIDVSYEDYCNKRDIFFSEIFDLLKLPLAIPPPSNFKKVIGDPGVVVENYDEIVNIAADMGEVL